MVLRLAQSTTYHRSPFPSVHYSETRSLCERYLGRRTARSNLWCFCEPCTRRFAITGDIDGNLPDRKIFAERMIMNHLNVAMYIIVYSGHSARKTTCRVRLVSSLGYIIIY